jgi:hypothetical protein
MAVLMTGSVNAIGSRVLAVLVVVFGMGLGAGACFNPNQPICAFSCAEAGLCPSGYTCGADKFCHKEGATGICPLDDAGTADAAPHDAAPAD